MEVFFGGPEFGDLYHAAAFVAISSEHRVTIVPNVGDNARWQPTRDFLDKISPGSTRICQHKGNAENIGHTANVFHQQRHTNLPAMVSSKLTTLLKTECNTIHEHAAQLVTQ